MAQAPNQTANTDSKAATLAKVKAELQRRYDSMSKPAHRAALARQCKEQGLPESVIPRPAAKAANNEMAMFVAGLKAQLATLN